MGGKKDFIREDIVINILCRTERHKTTWREKPQWYWFWMLLRQCKKLAVSLLCGYGEPVHIELEKIASIAMNWIDMRRSGENNQTDDP